MQSWKLPPSLTFTRYRNLDDKPEYHMISPQLKNEMTKRDWINLWLYEILCK
jgi:hypothetical protein